MWLISSNGNIYGRKIGDQTYEIGSEPVEVNDDDAKILLDMSSSVIREYTPDKLKIPDEVDDLPVYVKETKTGSKAKAKAKTEETAGSVKTGSSKKRGK